MGLYEGIKDVAKIVQQADNVDLYRKLIDLSAQALEMQNTINNLTQENLQLKQVKSLEDDIERSDKLFVTRKSDTNPDKLMYCSKCWDVERKLVQMRKNNGEVHCPNCNAYDIYDRSQHKGYGVTVINTLNRKY